LIANNGQMRTLTFTEEPYGLVERYRFLYCGSCGTAFAISRLKPDDEPR
jgi:hypothetical protein